MQPKNGQVEPLCVDIPTAAKLLGVSRNLAYKMASLGQLPVIRCGERRLVVPLAALRKMLGDGSSNEEKLRGCGTGAFTRDWKNDKHAPTLG